MTTSNTVPFSFAFSVFSRPECIGALEHNTRRILFLDKKSDITERPRLIFYHADILNYYHYAVIESDNKEVEMSENGYHFSTCIWGKKNIILEPVMKMSDCAMFKQGKV